MKVARVNACSDWGNTRPLLFSDSHINNNNNNNNNNNKTKQNKTKQNSRKEKKTCNCPVVSAKNCPDKPDVM